MSLHAQVNPEAQARLAAQRRNSTIASIVIALLVCVLLGLIFWMLKVLIPQKTAEPIVSYISDEPASEEPVKEKVVNQVKKKPSSPSSSAVSIITANAPSEISIPVPEVEVETLSVEFGESDGFGDGWGSGSGNGSGGSGGGTFSLFGKTGGSGLKGSFYDLKQDRDGKKLTSVGKIFQQHGFGGAGTGHRVSSVKSAYKKLLNYKFSSSSFKQYFKADQELTFTNLVIPPKTEASQATQAFGVEGDVKPSAWVVVYEGKVTAPKSGAYYRFVGSFDDYMSVYVNGKLVLNSGIVPWNLDLGNYTKETKVGMNIRNDAPLRCSKYIRFSNNTDVKIVVCESPGGLMGGALFIQEKGKEYKKDAQGGPILPPFTTEALREEDKERMRAMTTVNGGHFPIEVDDVPVFSIK